MLKQEQEDLLKEQRKLEQAVSFRFLCAYVIENGNQCVYCQILFAQYCNPVVQNGVWQERKLARLLASVLSLAGIKRQETARQAVLAKNVM